MIALFSLSASCDGGDEPPTPPPVVIEQTPTILEFSIAPNVAITPYGSDIIIKYKGDINTKKISINGIDMPNIDGTFVFKQVLLTTDYIIVATNITKTASITKKAVVGDWKTSKLGLLTFKPWRKKSSELRLNGLFVSYLPINEQDLNANYYWYLDGTYNRILQNGTVDGPPGYWKFSEDLNNLLIGRTDPLVSKIIKLTETEWEFEYPNDPLIPNGYWIRARYYRP